MIPVMMRFWMPHGSGGVVIPPGDNYTCVTPALLANFDTDGPIDGDAPETAPADTYYDSASATATSGWVSPANFDIIMDGDAVRNYQTVLQTYVHTGETVKFSFKTTSVTDDSGTIISVEFATGAGAACTFAYQVYASGSLVDEVTDTFSIGASSATVLVHIEIVEADAIYLYLSPDFVTPIATLAPADVVAYFDWYSVRVTSTGNNSAVDYIRCCGSDGIEEG
jgi:sarcosine oxidase gamma subunit